MPMTAAGLSAALFNARKTLPFVAGNGDGSPELQQDCDVIAAAIVAYLQSNATVVPTALVAPGGGGPVTGVGTLA